MKLTASQMTGLGAGALVYCKETQKFLLGLRSDIGDAPNTWCCFGGGVERGETIEQGIFREFNEEAGVRLNCPLYKLHENVLYGETGQPIFVYHNYLAIVERPFDCHLNSEHVEWGWFAGDEIPMPLHPEFRKALAEQNSQLLLTSLKGV